MATRVGSPTTFADDAGGSATHATAAKSTTTGNLLIAGVKWEATTTTLDTTTPIYDTAGNTWVKLSETYYGGTGEPRVALFYAANITGNASNVVTFAFNNTLGVYTRGFQEEFSGLATSSVTDGSVQTNTGTSADYSTSNITTSTTGLVALCVGDYAALSNHTGTPGAPDFSVGATTADLVFFYLISNSAQTVTPGGGADGNSQWVAIAQAFKDANTQSNAPRAAHQLKLMGAM